MLRRGTYGTVHLDYRFVLFSNHAFFFGLGYGILSAEDSGIFLAFGHLGFVVGSCVRCLVARLDVVFDWHLVVSASDARSVQQCAFVIVPCGLLSLLTNS